MPGDDTNSRTPKLRRCSFCGKTSDQVRRMVAGPNAQICNECILLCQEIINDDFSAVHDSVSGSEMVEIPAQINAQSPIELSVGQIMTEVILGS